MCGASIYPEVILAGQLYGFSGKQNISKKRVSGLAAELPKQSAEKSGEMKQQRIHDSQERIPIEGKFGQGKNGHRLNSIRAKLQKTSEQILLEVKEM